MTTQNQYAILGLRALKRASKKVAENAIKNNYKLPFWINGKVEYKTPSLIIDQPKDSVENSKLYVSENKNFIDYA